MSPRRRSSSAAVAATFLLLLPLSCSHNITAILSTDPTFSTFNHYLSLTHLSSTINSRETITVCALSNDAISTLLSKNLSISSLKNVLSLHILLDYFDSKKLHQITDGTALSATLFQATGSATGTAGFVNITDLKGGKVGFGVEDNIGGFDSVFVKEIKTIPYNISVIQISKVLESPEAEAPAGAEVANLTTVMAAHGCKVFADTLSGTEAEKTYESNLEGGLTVFCPGDDAFKNFLPKYHNLTATGKTNLLLYHGIPIYQSLSMLKSSNGLTNTLATDGKSKYAFTVQNDGDDVTIETSIVTSKITGTVIDEQPLAIYSLDKVLLPKELFKKSALAPAPAPAPVSPKKGKKAAPAKGKHASPPAPDADAADSPADGPDGDVADSQDVKNDGGYGLRGGGKDVAVALGLWFGLLLVFF